MKILKIAALSLVIATPLAAQTQTQEPYVNLFSDEGITARLTESGYSDIAVTREGTKLMIDASKDGAAHKMVYDMTTGALIEVDGAGYSLGTPPAIGGEAESGSESGSQSGGSGSGGSGSSGGDSESGGSDTNDSGGDTSN